MTDRPLLATSSPDQRKRVRFGLGGVLGVVTTYLPLLGTPSPSSPSLGVARSRRLPRPPPRTAPRSDNGCNTYGFVDNPTNDATPKRMKSDPSSSASDRSERDASP